MKIDFSRTMLLTLIGAQVIILICLYALEWRISVLESSHENPVEQK